MKRAISLAIFGILGLMMFVYDAVNINTEAATARFAAALQLLKQNPHTDPTRIAAIGYCFGGSIVLNMASIGMDLKGVASFHGGLSLKTPPQTGQVKAKIRVY